MSTERLSRKQLADDPFEQFGKWFADAEASDDIQYAAAACLSTVDGDGFPEGRMVMVQAFDDRGFAFFTDDRSKKAQALRNAPKAALTFYWGPFERQIRIQGPVEPGTEAEADEYFQRRPRRSQVTAWASYQSEPLESRDALARHMADIDEEFADRDSLPRPPYWKVYRVLPHTIEFWTARARRLHDRFLYRRTSDDNWTVVRLQP